MFLSSGAQPPPPTAVENVRKKRKLEELAQHEPEAKDALIDLEAVQVPFLVVFVFDLLLHRLFTL